MDIDRGIKCLENTSRVTNENYNSQIGCILLELIVENKSNQMELHQMIASKLTTTNKNIIPMNPTDMITHQRPVQNHEQRLEDLTQRQISRQRRRQRRRQRGQ